MQSDQTNLIAEPADSLEIAGGSLAVQTDARAAIMENVFGPLSGRACHNFVGSPAEIWRKVAIANGPSVRPGSDIGQHVIDLRYWYAHVLQFAGDTPGEIVEQTRIVLFDVSGDCWSWVSAGVVGDLARIIQAFGFGPYDGAVKFRVERISTSGKRYSYKIVPV